LSSSLDISKLLPGMHRVRAPRADGGVTEFWYAWRGGPRILRASAKSDALLAAEIARLAPVAIAAFEAGKRPADSKFLFGLITRYLASPAFEGLAERTRRDRRKFLDRARDDLGEMALTALEARGARKFLIDWRDRFQKTPKTADELLGALSIVLQWAHDKGEIGANPVHEFPRIYHCNRAEVIWEPQHFAIALPHSALELQHALRFAALTGLREADLIKVPKTAVRDHGIVWQTGKSSGRRTVVIPITEPLRALLAEILASPAAQDSVTVLNSSRGRPWTASGLAAGVRRMRIDAAAAAVKARGPGAESGIAHLRIHDLRGTAATNFIRAGLELGDVATILGWKKEKVEQIALRYVTAEAISLAIVERLRRNTAGIEA